MRILFLNQFFHPDTAATSQYLTDLTRCLSSGNSVSVICGASGYTEETTQRFNCGWHVEPGDSAGLIGLLYRLAYNRDEIERCGARARAAFEAHFDRHVGVQRVARIIGVPDPAADLISVHPRSSVAKSAEVK